MKIKEKITTIKSFKRNIKKHTPNIKDKENFQPTKQESAIYNSYAINSIENLGMRIKGKYDEKIKSSTEKRLLKNKTVKKKQSFLKSNSKNTRRYRKPRKYKLIDNIKPVNNLKLRRYRSNIIKTNLLLNNTNKSINRSIIKKAVSVLSNATKSAVSKVLIYFSPVLAMVLLITIIFAGVGGIYNQSGNTEYATGNSGYPFDNPKSVSITSPYGMRYHPTRGTYSMHTGTDFGTPHHCKIYTVNKGTVDFAGVNGGYGYCVIINHGEYYTLYAHLSQILVTEGDTVIKGQMIGREGGQPGVDSYISVGTSTGHHLHFEAWNKNRSHMNPFKVLPKLKRAKN